MRWERQGDGWVTYSRFQSGMRWMRESRIKDTPLLTLLIIAAVSWVGIFGVSDLFFRGSLDAYIEWSRDHVWTWLESMAGGLGIS